MLINLFIGQLDYIFLASKINKVLLDIKKIIILNEFLVEKRNT